jgi:hypothetical protein
LKAKLELANWTTVQVRGGEFRLRFTRLENGPSAGVEVLEIATGKFHVAILPTRGMSLWKAWCDGWELGWQSPVHGPIHPSLVRFEDPSGLGWLDGFDEFVVRCGLESNGAPEFDSNGKLVYPLHGRIGNIPAHSLEVLADPESGSLRVVGKTAENRFLIRSLELRTEYLFRVNENSFDCTDTVSNPSTRPSSMQLLYHINLGSPILDEGSRISIALEEIAPRDGRAAEGIDGWDVYSGPTEGYAEQVYLTRPKPDQDGWANAVLYTAESSRGVLVGFHTNTLPFFNLWKNTAAEADGYVTGLEPATGFPNPRSFEERNGRLVPLAAGESKIFRWRMSCLASPAEVQDALQHIASLQEKPAFVHRLPKLNWS